MPPRTKVRVKTNSLLQGREKAVSLQKALILRRLSLMLKRVFAMVKVRNSLTSNLSSVSEEQLKGIHSAYGESGLFKLLYMAFTHNKEDFDHFFKVIATGLNLLWTFSIEEDLERDNDKLPECEELNQFNSNVMLPSLSRKLYNPGSHHGYMVYGLGGPKILVSHPFQGISGEVYNLYNNPFDLHNNTIDVVTSLMMRGYHGRFLFLDNLHGLNFEVKGVPAWLLWFSLIAAHSDLVLFIKENDEGFSQSQRREIEFTPDRVQKKIVEIPDEELKWATKLENAYEHIFYITGQKGQNTKEEYYKIEAEHAGPFIREYANTDVPHDRLFRIELGTITEYPLDYTMYETQQIVLSCGDG
jgi:hypothetical protein